MFITIRQRSAALMLAVVSFVLGIFDRGLDSIIGSLTSLEAKLERYEARLDTRVDLEANIQTASYRREYEMMNRETAIRTASRGKQQDLINDLHRSQRIRERIAKLLD